MSAKTIDLLSENQTLSNKLAKLKVSNALLTESEGELAKKNQANQRVIKMLVDRLKESDEMLEIAYDSARKGDMTELQPLSDRYENDSQQLALEEAERGREENSFLREEIKLFQDFTTQLHNQFLMGDEALGSNLETYLETLKTTIIQSLESPNKKLDESELVVKPQETSRMGRGRSSTRSKSKAIDISPIIDAIPETPSKKVEIELPRSVAVQTLPLFIGPGMNAPATQAHWIKGRGNDDDVCRRHCIAAVEGVKTGGSHYHAFRAAGLSDF
ncbi:hypothetical protein HDU67_002955 [Dinochytrium kinnereticum]|nr:hypothetical protein HDU67_002955 [Dinochytrium kinnereticum]